MNSTTPKEMTVRRILRKVDTMKTADNPEGNPFMSGNLSVEEAIEAINAIRRADAEFLIAEFERVTGKDMDEQRTIMQERLDA